MNFFKKYQTVIIFLVIVIGAYAAYEYFFAAPAEAPLTATTVTAAGSGPDQELIALLLELKGIHLDNTLFVDPIFQSLNDFSKELVVEPVGRPNPFAPISGTVAPTTPTTPPKTTPSAPAR